MTTSPHILARLDFDLLRDTISVQVNEPGLALGKSRLFVLLACYAIKNLAPKLLIIASMNLPQQS